MVNDKFYDKCMELFETDKECAKALGISVKYLYEVFEDQHDLKTSTIAKWCEVLNIPLAEGHEYFYVPAF